MTNQEKLQEELKEKVIAGVKPSDLKKLKKSKSADDIQNHHNPPTPLLQDQLTQKQKQIENLREQLETTNQKLADTTQTLDNSLLARYEAVKQFGITYEKLKQIRKELDENVNYASDELQNQDDTIKKLRTNSKKTQARIRELEQDLNLTHKLARMRKVPLPDNNPN
jgi:chromosome segregation ATPase